MTITLKFQLKNDDMDDSMEDNTTVEFSKIDDPMTSDDLVDYFLRFGLACGFASESVLASMYAIAYENLPKEDLD